MGQLSPSQIDRALCKLMGLHQFKHDQEQHEITCEFDLDLMEKYDDFKYVSAPMFTAAVNSDDLSSLTYDAPERPSAKMQTTISSPLDKLDKISLDTATTIFFELADRDLSQIKTDALMPEIEKFIAQKKEEERKKAAALAEERRKEKALAKAKRKKGGKDEAEAPAPEASETADAASAADTASAGESQASEGSESAATPVEGAGNLPKQQQLMQELRAVLAEKHHYAGRKISLRFLEGWHKEFAAALYSLTTLHNQLKVVDVGIPDMMRDVIVYEWFNNLSPEEKAAAAPVAVDLASATLTKEQEEAKAMGKFGEHELFIERLYSSLYLSEVVFFPDGKSIFWLSMREPMFGEHIAGFGIDIDPPYKRNYAIGIKHIFAGKLDDHPSLKLYREMLAHPKLKEVTESVHFSPNDNISPFTLEETSEQMSFINDAYLIFDMPLEGEEEDLAIESDAESKDDKDAKADKGEAKADKGGKNAKAAKNAKADQAEAQDSAASADNAKAEDEATKDEEAKPKKTKTIEVLVKYEEGKSLDNVAEQLVELREHILSDYHSLLEDVVDTIAEALVERKNAQELSRRRHDEEYESYVFKDPIHRTEFTLNKLKSSYPLAIERVILSADDEIKLVLPSLLFAYLDKDDDMFQEVNESLGLVHADAIVVSLKKEGEGYDFAGLDIADCVQIPFGRQQNQDVDTYNDEDMYRLVTDLDAPIPADWDVLWRDVVAQHEEEVSKGEKTKSTSSDDLATNARKKSIASRSKNRTARKQKKK